MTKSAALLGPVAYLGQLSSVLGRTIVTTAEVRQIKKIYCSIVKSIFF